MVSSAKAPIARKLTWVTLSSHLRPCIHRMFTCSLVPCSLVALCTGLVHSLYPLDVHCGVCTHVCFCLQNILISSWKTYNKERGGGFCVCIVLGTVEETETKDKPHVPLCRRQKNEHDHSLCCSAQANMCSAQANMFRGYKLWIRL